MSKIKPKLEKLFERAGRSLYRNPIKTLVISLLFIGTLLFQLPKMTFDTSPEGMLHENDSSMIIYNRFQEQFGLSNLIVIAIEPPDIFDDAFLKKLQLIHSELEDSVPYVREVTSLYNARDVRGIGDVLHVNALVEDWRKDDGNFDSLKKTIFSNPFYANHMISDDKKLTAIVIDLDPCSSGSTPEDDVLGEFDETGTTEANDGGNSTCSLSGEETMALVDAVKEVIEKYRGPDFQIAVAGGTVISDTFNRYVKSDMTLILILANFAGILFLAAFFRRISGVLMPNIIVNFALFSTIGLMVGSNIALSSISSVIPAFLLAVGIADSVHILAIFYREFDRTGNKEDSIAHAMGHSGLAIVMTSLTTTAGLLSFSISEIADISEMGIFSAAGVMLALIYTLIMLPALISISPIKQKSIKHASNKKRSGRMDRILVWFADFSTGHPIKIIVVSLVILIVSVYGVSKLRFSENLLNTLPDSETVKKDNLFIDQKFRGTVVVEVIVDTKTENGIYDPEILNKIEKLTGSLKNMVEADIFVGKIFSIADFLKETNQALHENNPEFYTIPQDRETVAQEFLMFENSGSDELEKVVDSQFSKTRISIKIPYADSFSLDRFTKKVRERFENEFKGRAEITITGLADVMAKSFVSADRSMASSYKIAFSVITVMMIILVGSIKYGLLSMIPNLLPIIAVMGLMGLCGIVLDLNGLLIGSIAIGLVVDDTMHFMYNFRKFYFVTGDVYLSVKETLLGTGRALLITSFVLISSFLCLLFATLSIYTRFGFFTAIVISLALLADFVLAPALLTVFIPDKKGG